MRVRVLRRRPCRICRKWFSPHPRAGDRQKTCGSVSCRKAWHARKCREWNRSHSEYFKAIYLTDKLTRLNEESRAGLSLAPPPRFRVGLPRREVQEVIGPQGLVIIEYFSQLSLKRFQRFQEVMRV
jgi:hypothetical protein